MSQRGLLWPPCLKQYLIPLPIRVLATNMQRAEWRALKPPSPHNGLAGRERKKDPPKLPLTLPCHVLPEPSPLAEPKLEEACGKGFRGDLERMEISPHPLPSLPLYLILLSLESLPSYLMLTFVS